METLTIIPDAEAEGAPSWADLNLRRVVEPEAPIVVAGLSNGTARGNPAVLVRIDLPDGVTVIAQTTLALFLTAADALQARHGDPR